MTQINILETKTDLTKLIDLLEQTKEGEITICIGGVPVAKLTKYEKKAKRTGVAKGFFGNIDLETFNSMNQEIEKDFYGE